VALRTRRTGFTLLELLLVLVIVAVLAVFVLPSLTGSRDRRNVEVQSRSALALTRKARALASAEGRVYVLVVDREKRELSLARRRDPLAEATNEDDPELDAPEDAAWRSPISFEEGVALESFEQDGELVETEGALHVAFFPVGEADDVRLLFQSGDDRLQVRVDPALGLARVEEVDE
jgi:type II secretion system protein H